MTRKTDGYMMAPQTVPPRTRPPSGMAYPIRSGGNGGGDDGHDDSQEIVIKPVPVVLTTKTLAKIIAWVFGPMLIVISAGLYWYHCTNLHMDNTAIHLEEKERGRLETKAEAKVQRTGLVTAIKAHNDVRYREILVQQREDFSDWSKKQKLEHEQAMRRILSEVRQTRRDVRRAGRPRPRAVPTSAPASPP